MTIDFPGADVTENTPADWPWQRGNAAAAEKFALEAFYAARPAIAATANAGAAVCINDSKKTRWGIRDEKPRSRSRSV